MTLQDETIQYINLAVRSFYYKAIENGAQVTSVKYLGAHIYKVSVGNMELTYMGTADGKAKIIGTSGDVF